MILEEFSEELHRSRWRSGPEQPLRESLEYWIYDEGKPTNMPGRRNKRYIIEMGI